VGDYPLMDARLVEFDPVEGDDGQLPEGSE
jgi:hypothetical protein